MIDLRRAFILIGLSIGTGILGGLSASLFLYGLDFVTQHRQANAWLIYLLPLGGLIIGVLYHYLGTSAVREGNGAILKELDQPQKLLPLRMAPLVLIGTWLTHWFGGSAGREGTSVQMSAVLSDQFAKHIKLSDEERRCLLSAGLATGFASAIGAPLAGVIFGVEYSRQKKWRWNHLPWVLIASLVGYGVTLLCQAPHTKWPLSHLSVNYSGRLLLSALEMILVCTALVVFFKLFVRLIELKSQRYIQYPPLRPLLGGLILLLLFQVFGHQHFAGLGIEQIQAFFIFPAPFHFSLWKLLLTAVTLGFAFKGGEFIPMVFSGTAAGSFIFSHMQSHSGLGAALGFGVLYGAVTGTPVACAILVAELFGWYLLPVAWMIGVGVYFGANKMLELLSKSPT